MSEKPLQFQRNRWLVLFLITLIVSLCIIFAWVAVNTAREMRLRYTQERVLSTARLVARLLDKECDAAISVTQVLANRPGLAEAIHNGRKQTIQSYLSDAVDLVPDLQLAAVYGLHGQVLSCYPSFPAPPDVVPADFFHKQAVVRQISTLPPVTSTPHSEPKEVLVLAIPIKNRDQPVGHLQVYYRVGEMNRWLRQLRMGKGTFLYVIDPSGQIIATGGDASAHGQRMNKAPFIPPLQSPAYGVSRAYFSKAIGDSLVGYARAQTSGWTVLVVQSTQVALAATNYVVSVLSLLFIPLFGIILGAGWLINKLYAYQETLVLVMAEQNEQLRQADRVKSDFLANVSHDLRTPLASIQLCLSGLLDPSIKWNREQAQESLQLANEGLRLLTAKVRNLLEMARIEAHAVGERRELCDMTDIVGAALEKLAPMLNGRAIPTHFPPEPLLVECDQSQMETVVLNLVENAIKYSPAGTPIRLSGERRNGSVIITVQDEGPGIAPGCEERVFEKFYRAPSHQTTGGTGLGLAICKAIVEAHGGTIGVRNAPSGGSVFWFSLPAFRVRGEDE